MDPKRKNEAITFNDVQNKWPIRTEKVYVNATFIKFDKRF